MFIDGLSEKPTYETQDMAVNCRAASKNLSGLQAQVKNATDGHAFSHVSGQDELVRRSDHDAPEPVPMPDEDGLPSALRRAIFHWNFFRVVVFLLLVTSFVGEGFPPLQHSGRCSWRNPVVALLLL